MSALTIGLEYSKEAKGLNMIGELIRLYRCKKRLSQKKLAAQVFLNQSDISDLELGKADAIDRFNSQCDRFSALKSLLEQDASAGPIRLFHRSGVPNIQTQSEWIAFVPQSRAGDCDRLFDGRDVSIVVQN